eukprot:scaffold4965_cov256-Pinguiococcus_pyrenoidosus.AAC.1
MVLKIARLLWEALAERGLPSVPQLINLDLSFNSIGPEGAKALADRGLSSVPQLTNLDLSGSRIGPEGAKALAMALLTNQAVLQDIRGLTLCSYLEEMEIPAVAFPWIISPLH